MAARSSRRALGRSALIVALIALPVTGAAAAALVGASMLPTGAEQARVLLGRVQASVTAVDPGGGPIKQSADGARTESENPSSTASSADRRNGPELAALLSPGVRNIPITPTTVTMRTRTGQGALNAAVGAAWDPALSGRYAVLSGRSPRDATEIMATPAALSRLGVRVGQQTRVLAPQASTVTVVGTIRPLFESGSYQAVYSTAGAFGTSVDQLADAGTTVFLPDTGMTWREVRTLNRHGVAVTSRQVLATPSAPRPGELLQGGGSSSAFVSAAMVIGFAVLEVVLLAGAAFLVGARAQQRSLATLSSVGARRGTLIAVIAWGGIVLGAVGGLVGVAAGIGVGSAFMRMSDDGNATRYWGYHLQWPVMAAIVGCAALVGLAAAAAPAVRASRIDVVSALRGARRPQSYRARRSIAGVAIALVGCAATLAGGALSISIAHGMRGATPLQIALLVGGPALTVLGVSIASPVVLRAIAKVSGRGPVSLRLATRDAARNPGRSVPALATVLVTAFVASLAVAMVFSAEETGRRTYQYQAQLGQLPLRLEAWTSNGRVAIDTDRMRAAVRAVFPDAAMRTVSGVGDPASLLSDGAGEPRLPQGIEATTLLPRLTVPAANQCPTDPGSVNFDPDSAAQGGAEAANDPRCRGVSDLIMVGDADDVAALTGVSAARVGDALRSGAVVAIDPRFVSDSAVHINWWSAARWLASLTGKTSTPITRQEPQRTDALKAVTARAEHAVPYGIVVSPETAKRLGLASTPKLLLVTPASLPTQAQLDDLTGRIDGIVGAPGSYYAFAETGPPHTASIAAWALLGICAVIAAGAAAVAIGLARFDARTDTAVLAAVGAAPRTSRTFGFWQAIALTGTGALLGTAAGLVSAIALTLPGSGTAFAPSWPHLAALGFGLPAAIACLVWLVPTRRPSTTRRTAIG